MGAARGRGGRDWRLGVKLRQIEGLHQAPGEPGLHQAKSFNTARDGGTPVETILCTRESELETLMTLTDKSDLYIIDDFHIGLCLFLPCYLMIEM